MSEPAIIDLRSDTVTKPTPEMRRAMADAEVGDDVLGADPTAKRLQEKMADLFGKEAALFVPSGTMANQIAIRAQTEPGDEIIAHGDSHIYFYESGAPFALSGCSIRLLPGNRGQFEAGQVRAVIRPTESHFAQTRLIVVENTHNRGGGSIWPVQPMAELRALADELGLAMHLDGARLMNACVATGVAAREYTQHFDTVSMCFSKGLGAPVGSIVAGSAATMRRCHRFRKMFGGGMRQVGIIAAAAEYAIEHHVDRLADDHANARRLAEALAEMPGVGIDPTEVETNIVFFNLDQARGTAADFCARLEAEGVWMLAESAQRIRALTHLDVDTAGIDRAIDVLGRLLGS